MFACSLFYSHSLTHSPTHSLPPSLSPPLFPPLPSLPPILLPTRPHTLHSVCPPSHRSAPVSFHCLVFAVVSVFMVLLFCQFMLGVAGSTCPTKGQTRAGLMHVCVPFYVGCCRTRLPNVKRQQKRTFVARAFEIARWVLSRALTENEMAKIARACCGDVLPFCVECCPKYLPSVKWQTSSSGLIGITFAILGWVPMQPLAN